MAGLREPRRAHGVARGAAEESAHAAPRDDVERPAGAHRCASSLIFGFPPHCRRSDRSAGAPAACSDASCRARVTRLVWLILLVLSWCCGRGTSQVPAQCGTPFSGLHGSGEQCKGWYAGSHAGFKTTCGDGYSRGGGCELGLSFAFGRHDADGDAAIDAQESRGLLAAMGVTGDEMGVKFEDVDRNHDRKMTRAEWEAAGNIHPPIAMRVKARSGLDRIFPVESADFGVNFRDMLGQTYDGPLWLASPIEGCSKLQGPLNVYKDKMVLIHRGSCEFCVKAKMAQDAGARAVIVANNDESLIRMTVGSCGQGVTIPSIMTQNSTGTLLELVVHHESVELIFPTCLGDGTVMPGYGVETCDDGNHNSGDGCNAKCIRECGNSVIDGAETCDDGNLNNHDGCSSTCSLEPGFLACSPMGCVSRCGDGIAVGGIGGCELGGEKFSRHVSNSQNCPLHFC